MNGQRWQDWVTALLGIWVFITPWAIGAASGLDTAGAAAWSHYILGIIIVAAALGAVFAYRVWEEWVEVVLGLITIAMPWLLGFAGWSALTISDVIAGILVVALSGWMAVAHPEGAS